MCLSYHIYSDGQVDFQNYRVRIALEIRKKFLAQLCGYQDVKSEVADWLSHNTTYFRSADLLCQDKTLVFLGDIDLCRSTRKRGNDYKASIEQTVLEQ
jgi:hypothetical protein